MGIRWQLFSGEDAMTEVGIGLWAHTWASEKSLYGVLQVSGRLSDFLECLPLNDWFRVPEGNSVWVLISSARKNCWLPRAFRLYCDPGSVILNTGFIKDSPPFHWGTSGKVWRKF